jgi:multiple sugar transport system ATP-binding protein/alpha-glucoside transport system ATP-binding protein
VFLFDEPLSNLDAALRVQTRLEIARLHQRLEATMIYVTHDQVEAMTLADKIVVLRDGNIEQVGSPLELYERPENTFVAQFIGSPKMNFFEAKDLGDGWRKDLGCETADNDIIGLRPEHMRVCEAEDAAISGQMELIEQLGEYALVHLVSPQGVEFIVKMEHPPKAAKGAELHFDTAKHLVHVFASDTGQRRQ